MMPHRSLSWSVCLGCLFLASCGIGQLDGQAPLTIFDNFRVLEDGQAYRSAQLDGESLALVLAEYDIKTVVNLRGYNPDEQWYQNEVRATDAAGVELVDIAMSANRMPTREELLELYDTFKTAEHPILIHCKAGADRTGMASVIWRMIVQGDSKADASIELSPLYGHFEAATPDMDRVIAMFQPSREWIENEYDPNQ